MCCWTHILITIHWLDVQAGQEIPIKHQTIWVCLFLASAILARLPFDASCCLYLTRWHAWGFLVCLHYIIIYGFTRTLSLFSDFSHSRSFRRFLLFIVNPMTLAALSFALSLHHPAWFCFTRAVFPARMIDENEPKVQSTTGEFTQKLHRLSDWVTHTPPQLKITYGARLMVSPLQCLFPGARSQLEIEHPEHTDTHSIKIFEFRSFRSGSRQA